MWNRWLLCGCALVTSAAAQTESMQVDLANLREDVRGLVQRVGDLALRVDQVERENQELKNQASAAQNAYVTVAQLKDTEASLAEAIRVATGNAKAETLEQVSRQMEKLAQQTNAAIDSLAKGMATHAPVQTTFANDYAKEGTSYTVQRGDTLAEIAKKTGAKLQDIVNANKLTDPSRITVGQTLFIPGGK